MADLVIIVPTRGRPAQLARLVNAVAGTTCGRAEVLALVDDDDETRGVYLEYGARHGVHVMIGERQGLVGSTNHGARLALEGDDPPTYLASLGDDHLPRTLDWDVRLIKAIRGMSGPGWAYGNDLLQGERLPTAWVQHADTVRALGWMMLPTLQHMYPDNVVADLGRATDRLAYIGGVIIEHMHPAAGKADVDESYAQSNRAEQYLRDQRAYDAWRDIGMDRDATLVAGMTWTGARC